MIHLALQVDPMTGHDIELFGEQPIQQQALLAIAKNGGFVFDEVGFVFLKVHWIFYRVSQQQARGMTSSRIKSQFTTKTRTKTKTKQNKKKKRNEKRIKEKQITNTSFLSHTFPMHSLAVVVRHVVVLVEDVVMAF
jgi:hypothetical protein